MNYITNISQISSDTYKRVRNLKHLVLDIDGTIYKGKTLFPYTINFLDCLKDNGVSYSFLTNNASISTSKHVLKLKAMGLEIIDNQLYTAAASTIHYLKDNHSDWQHIFVLGTPSLVEQFESNGFNVLNECSSVRPDALIVSFDTGLTYSSLCHAAWLAKEGVPYFATNPDWVCPTDENTILVDCGSICSCIEAATGRKPDKVLGKPQPDMLNAVIRSRGLEVGQVAMVGDRIYTDMQMAYSTGTLSILVLSGESALRDAEGADTKPHIIVPSVKELGDLISYVNTLNPNNLFLKD